jgi:hypothetical protein
LFVGQIGPPLDLFQRGAEVVVLAVAAVVRVVVVVVVTVAFVNEMEALRTEELVSQALALRRRRGRGGGGGVRESLVIKIIERSKNRGEGGLCSEGKRTRSEQEIRGGRGKR